MMKQIDDDVILNMGVRINSWVLIVAEVARLKAENHSSWINLDEIVNRLYDESGHFVPDIEARMIFYSLLTLHEVKATFRRRCANCQAVIGKDEFTIWDIEDNDYECPDCGDSEVGDVQLVFWLPGVEAVLYNER